MSRTSAARVAALLALSSLSAACRTSANRGAPAEVPAPPGAPPPAALSPDPTSPPPSAPAPSTVSAPELSPEERVLVVEGGAERWITARDAEARGLTVVDLSDDWTPYIFWEHPGADGQPMHNRYRRVFVGLANDRLDEDGQPVPPGTKNYLELYGIPPSLSVMRARFLDDAARACQDGANVAALEAVETVAYIPPERVAKEELRIARLRVEIEQARRKLGVATLADLAERDPTSASKLKLVERRAAEKLALAEVERRLQCEGFLRAGGRHRPGIYGDEIQQAVKRFQQKHMIYESHYLRRETMDALARPPLDNDHRSLLRVLRERVVSASGIVEDGSADTKAGPPKYRTTTGAEATVPNLAEEYTHVAAEQLGWGTVEGALAFFRRHPAAAFGRLRAGVKLPPRPEYHGPNMDLSIVIDRGDVWYDLPWDDKGERIPQVRKKFPTFTLFVRHRNQRIPLVRWRTTIGGWRAEQASDGYEYFRYKGSDVGPRVIRQVIAGPVWIAPESTPIRSLVKTKWVGRGKEPVVNYDELGPGYLSAYGLVAGYFVVPGKGGRPDWDNGIRAHGSAEYLSMYSANGYSHGCHRLPNHLALRLYSFIVRHRAGRVVGDVAVDIARQFLKDGEVFEIRIPSRGYTYMLDPPVPVDVLEGEILGESKEPVPGYVPKPGVVYPGPPPALANGPEARAGGAAVPEKAQPGASEPGEAQP